LLLRAPFQRAGAEGLGIDTITPYAGGHMDLVDHPELSRTIMIRTGEQLGKYLILAANVETEITQVA
jgi:hypothetical protein